MTQSQPAPRRHFRLLSALLGLGLLAPACKDDKEDSAAKSDDAKPAAAQNADADTPAKDDAPADAANDKAGLAGKIAENLAHEITPADKLQRGDALAHFLVAHPDKMLAELAAQAVPSRMAPMLNEAAIKGMLAFPLGDKASLAQGLDFSKPVGCMIVNSQVVDVPLACTLGFKDGAAGLAKELGAEGQQSDAKGHTAHYVLGGEHLFIDDLDGQIVVSNHEDLFSKSKSYLSSSMIARADKVASDVEFVGFVAAAAERYERELDQVRSLMEMASGMSKTGQPAVDALMAYNAKSQAQSIDRLLEIEQLTVGIGFEPVGFVARFASFPVEGSKLHGQAVAMAAGPMEASTLTSLPDSSFVAFGMHADWKGTWDSEISKETRDLVIEAYAEATGKNAADVKTKVDTWMEANVDIYGNEMGFAMAYEPGTQGGIISTQSVLKPGGRDLYKELAKDFTPEAVLGPIAKDWVTWSFTLDAANVDGVAIDRMTITPGPKLEAEIRAKGGPELAEIEKRLGGYKLVIDRAETTDRVYYVFAPKAEEQYLESAIAASKGTGSLAGDKGVQQLLDRNPSVSMAMAFNGAKTLQWVRDVFPPEATAKIPPGLDLGNDFGDSYLVSSYGKGGSQTGEWVVGQPFIDQIKALAE